MFGRLASFLKDTWAKELVLVMSFIIGGFTIILPTLSPFTKYATMINQATLHNYPYVLGYSGLWCLNLLVISIC
uniref:NADH dehydrogenase [ubiquinone] 1 alpha subcomplex subunit 3 n=1 Tax=Felis catus TaxID=9685 RepID=A0ABI7W0B9_FELCA